MACVDPYRVTLAFTTAYALSAWRGVADATNTFGDTREVGTSAQQFSSTTSPTTTRSIIAHLLCCGPRVLPFDRMQQPVYRLNSHSDTDSHSFSDAVAAIARGRAWLARRADAGEYVRQLREYWR